MDGTAQSDTREQATAPSMDRPPQNLDAPSPAVVSDLQQPATATTHTTTNTDANAIPVTETRPASTGAARAGTPSSYPPTPTGVNQQSSPSLLGPNSATSQANKDRLRWRDPMTVQFDGGQAQPGKLKAAGIHLCESPDSPQLAQTQATQQQHHLPEPQHPHHQQQQQYPQPQHPPVSTSTPTPTLPPPPPPPAHPHGAPHHPQPHQPPHHQPQSLPQPLPPPHPHPHPPPLPYPSQHSQHPQQHPHQLPGHHHQQPAPQARPQIPHHYQQPPPPHSPATTLPPLHHPQPLLHHQPQPQPQLQQLQQPQHVLQSQVQTLPRAPLSKPVIMDPPAARKASQAQQQSQSVGFPSPVQDHARINPKFVDDCTRMNFAIQQSLPEAVRRIVRDHWEKCLLGSEFHQAFILNASIHHAVPSITQRAVRDFGHKMVAESKQELIGHFTAADLDEVADFIVDKVSDSFLDKCLAKRLLTIEAKPLINALAKAERLGYESNDMVQDDQHERVIPQEAYPGAAAAANGYQSQPPSQPPSKYPAQQQLQCMKCFRTFVHASAYEHHSKYNLCSQIPPSASGFEHSCPHCGQGFTNVDDLHLHINNMVCGNFGQVPKAPRGPGRPPRAAPSSQPNPVSILPSMTPESPAIKGHPATQPLSTPVHASIVRRATTATPGSAASPNPSDPYAHLTEHQLQQMNEDLLAAEAKYAPRFAEAEAIPDENLRRVKIEGLRNSFGTKQSMIRKKFGVRLRERRTKAEITAERERLGIKRAERERAKASVGAQRQNSSPSTNVDGTPRPTVASGWTAANTPKANVWDEHDAKRRRLDGSGGYQTPYKSVADDTPSRKTLSVSEIGGGLAGAAATAAMHDPTLPPTSQPTRVYEQSSARIEIHEPSVAGRPVVKAETHSESATPSGSDAGGPNGLSGRPSPTGPPPADMEVVAIEPDDSSSDDEDIPPTLPPHLRRNLPSSTSLLQTL